MSQGNVVLLGGFQTDRGQLDRLVSEFGWSLREVQTLDELGRANPVAVLIHPAAFNLTWHRALETVLDAAPRTRPIVCQHFSELIDWTELADAGAFHSLRLPLDLKEVRQSLGFVWAASHADSNVIPLIGRQRSTANRPAPRRTHTAVA